MCFVFSDCTFYDTLVIPNVRGFASRLNDSAKQYNVALCVMGETSLFYNTRVTYRHLERKRFSAHLLRAIYLLWCSRLLIGFIPPYFRNWTSAKKCTYVPTHWHKATHPPVLLLLYVSSDIDEYVLLLKCCWSYMKWWNTLPAFAECCRVINSTNTEQKQKSG